MTCNITLIDVEIDELLGELLGFELTTPPATAATEARPEPVALADEAKPCACVHEPEPITTRGKGAQKAARDAGARYIYQTDPRGEANSFHGFKTAAERDAASAAHIAAGLEVV